MFTQQDLDTMNEYCQWLQEIIEKNERDADWLEKNKQGLEYIDELRENAMEAKKILDRYLKLIEQLKVNAYTGFNS